MTTKRMGLRERLALVVLVPCLAVAALLGQRIVREQSAARRAEDLALHVHLATATGDLLHETQRERGSSSVYMSSNGTQFVPELEAQRARTDQRRLAYSEFVQRNESRLPPPVVAALKLVEAQLSEIEARRRQTSDLAAPVLEILGFYTELNRRLLATVESIASLSPDAELRAWSIAYLAFLHAKEYTGIERAQLSNVFGTDRFAPGQYLTVASLIASQKSYLQIFQASAPASVLAILEERRQRPVFVEVKEKEQLALAASPGAVAKGGFGVEAPAWFKLMTRKIDLLKEVEDATAATIIARAEAVKSDAASSLLWAAVLAAGFGALVVGSLTVAAKQIVIPIRRLTAIADRVSAGDVDLEVDTTGAAEIGELAQAFRRMVSSLKMLRALARKAPAGRLAGSRTALRS